VEQGGEQLNARMKKHLPQSEEDAGRLLPSHKGKSCLVSRNGGVALVIVLAFLVLITALVLAFFSSVTTELSGAKSFSSETAAKLLADSAVQCVMGQIKLATSGGATIAWASQPGMIRTYDDSGNPLSFCKLYSSNNMVVSGSSQIGAFSFLNNDLKVNPADVSTDWAGKPAIFTDLNASVVTSSGTVYPIVDGNGIAALTKNSANVSVPQYYTYASNGATVPDIDGFAIASGNTSAALTGSNNTPIPNMPVKWIYTLKDGTLTSPSGVDSSGKIANWTGVAADKAPSATNPIVGRIAFWTDDESCKVNINTATEGFYTDYPRTVSAISGQNAANQGEVMLGTNQPVAHEFQRYPSHPAMTSLSAIIKPPAGWTGPAAMPAYWTAGDWTTAQWGMQLYNILPRVKGGGSQAGSVSTVSGTFPMTSGNDRLYASVEELEFQPVQSGTGVRQENDVLLTNSGSAAVLNHSTLARARFFLTASSRAPDVNLFNKPRVCIWPIATGTGNVLQYRTTYDSTIAFCSTIGSYPYYFLRQDPTSATTDLPNRANSSVSGLGRNRMLLEYLRTLTGNNIPGFGGNFAAKYSSSGTAAGTDRDQILTSIFDYIRSTNLSDAGIASTASRYTHAVTGFTGGTGQVIPIVDTDTGTRGFGRFKTISGCALLFIANVNGDDPLVPRGPGPTYTPATPYPPDTSQVDSAGKPLPTYNAAGVVVTPAVAPGNIRIQAIFLPQFFDPSIGSIFNYSCFKWKVEGLDGLFVNNSALYTSAASNTRTMNFNTIQTEGDNNAMGDQMGITPVASSSLVSAAIDVSKTTRTFNFTGNNLKFTLMDPAGNTVQTVTVNFPGGTFPIPTLSSALSGSLAPNNGYANLQTSGPPYFNMRYFTSTGIYNPIDPKTPTSVNSASASGGGRISGNTYSASNAGVWFLKEDTVRGVAVKHGDSRLVAARSDISGTSSVIFDKVQGVQGGIASPVDYWNSMTGVEGMHNFVTGDQEVFYGSIVGRLVRNASYSRSGTLTGANYAPSASSLNQFIYPPGDARFGKPFSNGVLGTFASIPLNGVAVGKSTEYASGDLQGDFDNPPWDVRDGPYINKADEGDRLTGASNLYPYNWKNRQGAGNLTASFFTPNRMVASAVTFGSLPTGVFAGRPWQTLLFHPDPTGLHPGNTNRAGDGTTLQGAPPDHLLLDLFHMSVVEPYAVSEPLSTAGKINMNYQIAPFSYIKRGTGISAVLKSEKLTVIDENLAATYKAYGSSPTNIRFPIDADETMKGFDARFAANDIFRSASEICTLPIVPIMPAAQTYASMSTASPNFWDTRRLTGDNTRERIYETIYPRLTTKSNTYTVHYRVQTLKKAPGTNPTQWSEGRDQVTSEHRGAQTIERYVDAGDTTLPDFTANPTYSLDAYPDASGKMTNAYQFRVISTKKFAP